MIPEYKNILYTTDFSQNSRHVFRYALSVASMYRAGITVVHVVPEMDPSHVNYFEALIGEERYRKQEEALKKEIVEKFHARVSDFAQEELENYPEYVCVDIHVEVVHGDPANEILKAGERFNADLIVMGTHGKSATSHTWLGSVADKVLRKSHRPALVIPVP